MKRILFLPLLLLLCTCNNREKMEKEVLEKYEKESYTRALAEEKEWLYIKKLVDKATGLTTSSKEERKLALVKLYQKLPEINRWEDVSKSIEREEYYLQHDDLIFDIKKTKGWKCMD